jgi:hypothetical protein
MAANKLTVTDRATVVTLFSYIGWKTALATTMALTKRADRAQLRVHVAPGLCCTFCRAV